MPEIIMAFASLTFLIIYALKTRRMAESMVLATLLAMVLLHRQHFLTGTIDALYAQLSNSSYQFVLCIIIGFGGMITLFQESGALMGFRDLLLRVAKGPKRTLVLAWCMSVVMFVDEYLNALTVTFSMREITDRNRIPREQLALQANIMACCLCMTIPFSSWTAFSVGLVSEYDLGFQDYLRAIPYMIYPLSRRRWCRRWRSCWWAPRCSPWASCCAAQVCFDRIQAGAGIREGVHSRSSRVLNSTARRFSGILPLIYNEGGVIPIWILTAVTIRVTS